MATPQTFGMPALRGETVEDLRRELQAYLSHFANTLDTLQGNRGTPQFHGSIDMRGNTVTNMGPGTTDKGALQRQQSLFLDGKAFNAQGKGIFNLLAGVQGADAVNLDQLQQAIDEILQGAAPIDASYIVATNDSRLTAERALAVEAGVLTKTDTGANGTMTVGVETNGIPDAKLRQGAAISVIGRSANSVGNVADIVAATNGDVLQRVANALTFAPFASTALSDMSVGTFTATGTGFVANPTATAAWIKIGKLVCLYLPLLSGTSNATTFTVTGMSAAITPTLKAYHPVLRADNGVDGFGYAAIAAASTTITLIPTPGTANWTNAGTKTLYEQPITYYLL